LGVIHLVTKNAQELKRTPGRQEEDPETDENTMETFNRPL
jgi:hypothetical protein